MIAYLYDPLFLAHGPTWHPESARRLEAIVERLQATGLWDRLEPLEFAPASVEQVSWVHDPDHIEHLRGFCAAGGGALDADTYATEQTYEVAMLAAGAGIRAVEALMTGEIEAAFCLVRPPGHHAGVARARGFCFFNNVAIAAEAALRAGAARVAIIDFDAHHGNGTQEIFYHRGDVLYISLHQCPYYPGTGSIDEMGVDDGAGTTINIPVPAHTRDEHYLRAWQEVVLPALKRFAPGMILSSAGYDAHWQDPLTGLAVTAEGFYRQVEIMRECARQICAGRLGLILEGGYHLAGLPRSVENTFLALLGEPLREPEESAPPLHPAQEERINQDLDHAISTHRQRLDLEHA